VKNINILYEDDFCIIVNKPSGLAVQGGEGIKTSLDMLLLEYAGNRKPQPLLVHRLDRDTSGALLAAKGRDEAARFSRLLGSEKKAIKIYTAVCAGYPVKNEGIIKDELYIRGKPKKSETKYKVIQTSKIDGLTSDPADYPAGNINEYSVLEIELSTGRMHQIRRHLAMNKNPILGDDKYGDFALNKKFRKENGLKRLLLHASRLIIKECGIDIHAPFPVDFNRYFSHN